MIWQENVWYCWIKYCTENAFVWCDSLKTKRNKFLLGYNCDIRMWWSKSSLSWKWMAPGSFVWGQSLCAGELKLKFDSMVLPSNQQTDDKCSICELVYSLLILSNHIFLNVYQSASHSLRSETHWKLKYSSVRYPMIYSLVPLLGVLRCTWKRRTSSSVSSLTSASMSMLTKDC